MNLTTEELKNIIQEELEAVLQEKEPKKDACYKKIKAAVKRKGGVWPSAYASGRLVQCRNKGAANWKEGDPKNESINEEELSDEEKKELEAILRDEGGAAGMDPFKKNIDAAVKDIKKALEDNPEVGQHEDGDYILDDDEEIRVDKEQELEEKKKKKACKPTKGKRFAKRVDGKCRSFGQKGQAKGGGDRIRPGTKKGDAYCARSAKIKKCKNPPCANALSRKKWKCRGSKSMKEVEND
jgi:hypothetical protein